MYIVSSFEHSLFLELAISELEIKGIEKKNILAVPLEKINEPKKIFDTIHYSDGISLFDGASSLGLVFLVLGVIYGFVWKWGPIIWGLIGLFIGASLGLILDYLIGKKSHKKLTNKPTEVVLLINCAANQVQEIEKILSEHGALGIAKLGASSNCRDFACN